MRKRFFVPACVLAAAALGFIVYAVGHPELSFPWSVRLTHILYGLYVDAVALAEQGVGISIFPQTTYTPNDLVVSKVVTQPARQAEYVLVWSKAQQPSGLVQAFIDYVQDFLEEDKIHSQRFRVREAEHILPQETEHL